MKRLSLISLLLLASTALAQDITNHSIPIGGGPGAVGWKAAGPCATGQALVWVTGSGADPTCAAAGGSANIIVNSSSVTGGVSGNYFFNNAGVFSERTPTQTTANLNLFTTTLQGLVPGSGGGTVNFLRADGTWAPLTSSGSITINSGVGVGLTAPGTIALGGTGTIGAVTDFPRFSGINVPLVKPNADSTTAVQVTNAAGTNQILRVDTTNNRVGVNKTPGAFDLDVNGAANIGGATNVGGVFTFGTLSAASLGPSVSTITGLVANNTPSTTNDFFLYFSAADNAIRKCTVGSCTSAGVSGVSSLNTTTGALSLLAGTGLSVATAAPNITYSLSAARQTLPNVQAFTTGSNLTYTTPANALWIRVKIVGGGGGGAGGATGGNGSSGGTTCFGTNVTACTTPIFSAGPGTGGNSSTGNGGTGGAAGGSSTCTLTSVSGGSGTFGAVPTSGNAVNGSPGGNSTLGGGGARFGESIGENAATNSGSGGEGGGTTAVLTSGGAGGGAGATCEAIINSPIGSYVYTVGGGGGGGTAGVNGATGGNGAAGVVIVEAHFGT